METKHLKSSPDLPEVCPFKDIICQEPQCDGPVAVGEFPPVEFGALGLIFVLKMCPDDPRRVSVAQNLPEIIARLDDQ